MTSRIRRGPRRSKQDRLSLRLASVRRRRSAHLGTLQADLLGQARLRKMVALALLLTVMRMDKEPRCKNGHRPDRDNVCTYCLFFQPYPEGNRPLRGNCTYHKEWIANASRTTCSDMSSLALKESGIYELVGDSSNGWTHVRRTTKLRTRLFLVKR